MHAVGLRGAVLVADNVVDWSDRRRAELFVVEHEQRLLIDGNLAAELERDRLSIGSVRVDEL
jgi:hypothetical protein